MAYNDSMIFIETSIFTKEIDRLLPDENCRELQNKKTEQEDLTPDQLKLLRRMVKELLS